MQEQRLSCVKCTDIATACCFKHRGCLEYYWGRHQQESHADAPGLKTAFVIALGRNDAGILEFLLSNGCPWVPEEACSFFTSTHVPPWADWQDTYEVILKYLEPDRCPNLSSWIMRRAMLKGQLDFLGMAQQRGHTITNWTMLVNEPPRLP